MPYIGNIPALDYISYAVQNFTVTAGTTVYTLDYSVANENDIRLVINNVIQRPGASYAYSATGTTLTLTSATLSTDTMYAVFIGRAVQTVTPPANINIQLADGTAAAPSLNFANDTNTGIFRPTTDTIALTEGGVEGMRLNASGNVQFAGNIGLGGTTPTTSGTGITFPAAQSASTDANTLDDYEEGTWTPSWTASSGSMTYSKQSGLYTKIGRFVNARCHIITTANNSLSGTIQLNGFPFTVSEFATGSVFVENVNIQASVTFFAYVEINTTVAKLRYFTNNAGATFVQGSQLNAGSDMMFNFSYSV